MSIPAEFLDLGDVTAKAETAMSAAMATPSRLRAIRVAIPALALNTTAPALAVNWPTPYADANYTLTGCEIIGTSLLKITSITNLTASGFDIVFTNLSLTTALLAGKAFLHVGAIHDPAA